MMKTMLASAAAVALTIGDGCGGLYVNGFAHQ